MGEPAYWILEYEVTQEGDWWYARRVAEVNPEQRLHGVRQTVRAPTFDDLKLECVAQRIRASWYR